MAMRRKKNKKQQFEEKEIEKCNSTRDWAGLPEGILDAISDSLPVIDCISFADVCKLWKRIFAEFPTQHKNRGLPCLIMSRQNSRMKRRCVSLLENLYLDFEMSEACGWHLWGSFQDWLIMAKHFWKPHGQSFLKLMLFNPFSKTKIDLPDAMDCYHKMVLSANPYEKSLVCMLVHQERSKVAFWILGAQQWHKRAINGGPFQDAVFCGKSFYLVTLANNIVKIDAASISLCNDARALSDNKVEHCVLVMAKIRQKMVSVLRYLVESCGEILLVCRFFSRDDISKTEKFEIYRLNLQRSRWIKHSLGNQILVLGKGCSRSFIGKELGVKKSNCIYFLNDRIGPWLNEWDIESKYWLPRLQGSDESDWDIFSLDEDNHTFCYKGIFNHWAPICITAPLWWYCRMTSI